KNLKKSIFYNENNNKENKNEMKKIIRNVLEIFLNVGNWHWTKLKDKDKIKYHVYQILHEEELEYGSTIPSQSFILYYWIVEYINWVICKNQAIH
ncbi:hypothetical protein RFI_25931, partial [Reticulomyxa filosa]